MTPSVMSFDSVVESLRQLRIGTEDVLGKSATFSSPESGITVEAVDVYRDAAYSHVAVILAIGVGKSAEYVTMYVRESFADFAGAILRREIPGDGAVVPWQDVVEVIERAIGRRRLDYVNAYIAFMMACKGIAAPHLVNYQNRSAHWRQGERSMHLIETEDHDVSLSFVDLSTGTSIEHVIAESTATPHLVECKTYGDVLRTSGSCTLANAIDAAKAFLVGGFQR